MIKFSRRSVVGVSVVAPIVVLAALVPVNAAMASGVHPAGSRAGHSFAGVRPRLSPPVGRAKPARAAPNLAAGKPSPWVPLKHAPSFDPGTMLLASDGTVLAGLSQGAAYGDDVQDNTNFPLVRITNSKTGAVTYARTSRWTSVSIAPGAASSTQFTVPATTPAGPSTLVVVANGIASQPVPVTIR